MKTSLWRQPQQQLRCCWCQLSCALALLQWNLAYPQFFFPAQYEHKLIGHLVPFTNLLPGYTRRASPCLRRSWFPNRCGHTFHGSSCLPSQIQGGSLGPSTWQLSRFKHWWCQSWFWDSVFTFVFFWWLPCSPPKNIILSIASDRTVTACTWISWFSLFLSNCVTNNHQHSFTSYLWYFFPLPLYSDSLLAFFPKAFTSCLLCCHVHFLKSGSFHQAGMQIIRHMGSDSAIQFKLLYAASFSSACFGRN